MITVQLSPYPPRPAHLGLGEEDLGPDPVRWPAEAVRRGRLRRIPLGGDLEALAGPGWDGVFRIVPLRPEGVAEGMLLPALRLRPPAAGADPLHRVEEALLSGEGLRWDLLTEAARTLAAMAALAGPGPDGVAPLLLVPEVMAALGIPEEAGARDVRLPGERSGPLPFLPAWWGHPIASLGYHLALMAAARDLPPEILAATLRLSGEAPPALEAALRALAWGEL